MTTALALNVGSSTLKAALFEISNGAVVELDRILIDDLGKAYSNGLGGVGNWIASSGHPSPQLIAHRIVHGGDTFHGPTVVDDKVLEKLNRLVPLAPLHMPPAIRTIGAAQHWAPTVPQVACFDTAFHATLPRVAYDLGLPYVRSDPAPVRRYGFHGLSCQHVVDELGADSLGRAVIAHLGNGSSLTAVKDGLSIDTTMGFTPNGGIPMSTRSGDIDPSILIYLLRKGRGVDELEDMVMRNSGVTAWSNGRSDMRTLLESHDTDAQFAVEAFCVHVAQAAARLIVSLGGIDSFAFTGGIGEHAHAIRLRVSELLRPIATFKAYVVSANEEKVMVHQASVLLDAVTA